MKNGKAIWIAVVIFMVVTLTIMLAATQTEESQSRSTCFNQVLAACIAGGGKTLDCINTANIACSGRE